MADNISITPGSGVTVAADDIGAGVLVQRVKSCLGADGTAVDPVGGAGAVSTAVQRMTLASDDPGVTALQLIDNPIGSVTGGTAGTSSYLVGGYYETTAPTLTTGQQTAMHFDTRAALQVALRRPDSAATIGAGTSIADGSTNSVVALAVEGHNKLFNATTWDRRYGNVDTAALISLSAAAPTTTNSADQINYNGNGVVVVVDITAIATQTVVVNIQGKDIASGKYYTILSSASLGSTGTTALNIHPGGPTTANVSSALTLPRTWRVQVVGSVGGTVSLKVGASVICV